MAVRLVLFGAPGAGKGTQSEHLKRDFNIPHISTGDIFRKAMRENTPLGARARKFIDAGKLVPDDIVIGIVRDRLEQVDCENGFLLDGFPRTKEQAKMLAENLDNLDKPLSAVLSLEVPKDVLIKRLVGRRVCPECGTIYHIDFIAQGKEVCEKDGARLVQRKDDDEKTVNVRLNAFEEQTMPLKEFYEERNLLVKIDGSLSSEEVSREIGEELAKIVVN